MLTIAILVFACLFFISWVTVSMLNGWIGS